MSQASLLGNASPYTLSGVSPLQRKLLLRWSIFLTNHFCSGKAVIWYMGCDESIVLTSVPLPDVERSLPFQPSSLDPILSIGGCTSILRSFWMCSGSPRYLPGNLHIFPWNFEANGRWPRFQSKWGIFPSLKYWFWVPNIHRRNSRFCAVNLAPKLMGQQR